VVGHPPHQLVEDGHRPVPTGARMPVARPPQQSGNLINDGAGVVTAVRVAHQPDAPPLLLDRTARLADVDKAPDSVGEVDQPRTRRHVLVPVDQADRLVTDEDGVVRTQVAVTDDILATRQLAPGRAVVEAADEPSRARQLGIRQYGLRLAGRRQVDISVDEAQNLAPRLVRAQHPWRPSEPDRLQMPQHRLDEHRAPMKRPTNGVTHTNDTRRLTPALKPLLVHPDERSAPKPGN
jgi:hypothetical protein